MAEIPIIARADLAIVEQHYSRLERLHLFRPAEDRLARIAARLAVPLDGPPNRVAHGVGRALWLAPGEWLLIDQPQSALPAIADGDSPTALLNDVTDGFFGLTISGTAAVDLLARACPLDLHPDVFGLGDSALSVFAQVPFAVIRRPDGFEMLFDVSLRGFVLDWLTEACVTMD